MQCSIDGCTNKHVAKSFCGRHYEQYRRTGSPVIKRPNPRGTPAERFWRYVEKKGVDECWLWTGYVDKDGYGWLRVGHQLLRSHRFSYAMVHDDLKDDVMVLHTCHNQACVNPQHLYLGTHEQNMSDRMIAGHYAFGEKHCRSKISDAQVEEIRTSTLPYKELSRLYGISISQIGNIKRNCQRNNLQKNELHQ